MREISLARDEKSMGGMICQRAKS